MLIEIHRTNTLLTVTYMYALIGAFTQKLLKKLILNENIFPYKVHGYKHHVHPHGLQDMN